MKKYLFGICLSLLSVCAFAKEYKIITISWFGEAQTQAQLNKVTQQGWRVIQIMEQEGRYIFFLEKE